MNDLIAQARKCAACMIGADECHRTDCDKGCIDVIDELADALEKAEAKVEQQNKDAAAKYLAIVRLTARAEKAEAELAAYKEANPPRVHGEWVTSYKSGMKVSDGAVCSMCDCWSGRESAYCPNCGDDMRKETNSDRD